MDTRNLMTFTVAAHTLSFVHTARELHLSQPSVSARIQGLEEELGVSLFIRNGRSLQLSKEGEAFLPWAVQMLELSAEAANQMKKLHRKLEGKLTVGATPLWCVHILPRVLSEIRKRHPAVEFRVLNGNTAEITDRILANQVEIGLVGSKIAKPQIRQEKGLESDLLMVCHPGHRFARKREISMEELIAEPLTTYQQASDTWKQVERVFAEHHGAPNIAMELNQIGAAKEMVITGSCVGLMPRISVARELDEGQLVAVPVPALGHIKTVMYVAYLAQKETYLLVQLVRSAVLRQGAQEALSRPTPKSSGAF